MDKPLEFILVPKCPLFEDSTVVHTDGKLTLFHALFTEYRDRRIKMIGAIMLLRKLLLGGGGGGWSVILQE